MKPSLDHSSSATVAFPHGFLFMIRLPKALLEEIGSSTPTHSGIWSALPFNLHLAEYVNSGRSTGGLSRKDNRKQERTESKKRKTQHHALKQRQKHKRPAQKEHKDVPVAKKPRVCARSPKVEDPHLRRKRTTPLQKLADGPTVHPSLPGTREEDSEDAYIRYLEGRLGWRKNGTKTSTYGSGLADDGLDGVSIPPPSHQPA